MVMTGELPPMRLKPMLGLRPTCTTLESVGSSIAEVQVLWPEPGFDSTQPDGEPALSVVEATVTPPWHVSGEPVQPTAGVEPQGIEYTVPLLSRIWATPPSGPP